MFKIKLRSDSKQNLEKNGTDRSFICKEVISNNYLIHNRAPYYNNNDTKELDDTYRAYIKEINDTCDNYIKEIDNMYNHDTNIQNK